MVIAYPKKVIIKVNAILCDDVINDELKILSSFSLFP